MGKLFSREMADALTAWQNVLAFAAHEAQMEMRQIQMGPPGSAFNPRQLDGLVPAHGQRRYVSLQVYHASRLGLAEVARSCARVGSDAVGDLIDLDSAAMRDGPAGNKTNERTCTIGFIEPGGPLETSRQHGGDITFPAQHREFCGYGRNRPAVPVLFCIVGETIIKAPRRPIALPAPLSLRPASRLQAPAPDHR
ncbi:hypothetical protein DPEC_G00359720 [Dallia pectoralis]|uniref:Uncharacterized protein n=1 Tax=Dallia pectoralis TaxID=75939 RepID=A0ACC2F0P4_DALPE|nr:hypothetical protein DPEC_G00359720 [Dallia pectoralis]